MQKTFITLIIILFSIPSLAAHFEVNGMARVRSESSNNINFNNSIDDETAFTSYRFQMGLKVKKNKDSNTSVFLQPRFSKIAGDTEGDTKVTSGSLNAEGSFEAHQAYINHRINKNIELIAGRQELILGDQLLVGAVGWHNVGRAFDGFKVSHNSEHGKTDLFLMTIKEKSPYTTHEKDNDFYGVYHTLKTQSIDFLDFYYLKKQDLANDTANSKRIVDALGFRIKSQIKSFDYRLEYTVEKVYKYNNSEAGYDTEDASQYDLELGYKLNKFRLAAGVSMASEHFDQLYPTGHKWLGYADLFKRQNIAQKTINMNYKHDKKTNLSLSYHLFEIVETGDSTNSYQWNGPSISNDKDELGSEIDIVITHKVSNHLTVLVKHALFMPGEHYKKSKLDSQAQRPFLQLQTNF
jgi:hypothetical protein